MLRLYEVVRLKEPDQKNGITTKNEGVIVDILQGGKAYIVEFFDDNRETIEESLFTEYTEDQLIRIPWEKARRN